MKSIVVVESTSLLQARPASPVRKLTLNKETLGSLVDAEARGGYGIRAARRTDVGDCPYTTWTRVTAHCC